MSLVIVSLVFVFGCGSKDMTVAPVAGVVRLDGAPLSNAKVVFEMSGKRDSVGFTDVEGRYEMFYSPSRAGANVGKNIVKITADAPQPGLNDASRAGRPARIPVEYNTKSVLEAVVRAESNRFDFELKSSGK